MPLPLLDSDRDVLRPWQAQNPTQGSSLFSVGAQRSIVLAKWGVVRLKPARGHGQWESPEASSWEFLGAQVPRRPTTKRAGCPLPSPKQASGCSPEQEYFTIPTSRVSKRNIPKISRGATRYRCSRPAASGGMHTVGPGPSQRLAGKTFVPIESSEEPHLIFLAIAPQLHTAC